MNIHNKIYCCDCVDGMRELPDVILPLTLTSPPYDQMRSWEFSWAKFQVVAQELYRITMPGGIVVWVNRDQHKNWSESGTSFKQALYFKEQVGFSLLTTLVIERLGFRVGKFPRYWPPLEYAFVLSKGKPRVLDNLLRDRPTTTKDNRLLKLWTQRNVDGSFRREMKPMRCPEFTLRTTIWPYLVGWNHTTKDKEAFQHPALMPEELAKDLILSYSNPGDLVFDCFAGAGTTLKMAMLNNRSYLGMDLSPTFCELAERRLRAAKQNIIQAG